MRSTPSGPSPGDVPLTSATQVQLFRDCQRKWAFRYLRKLSTPQHPSAALGTEVDDTQLQPLLRDGRPLDLTRDSGYIALSGLEYLPSGAGHEVQKHFVLPSPASGGAFAFQGYIDLWLPDASAMPGLAPGAPCVCDFKTTSDLKWAKSEKALETDVQGQLYATAALVETKAPYVNLAWVYFQTRGPRRARRVHLRVYPDHALEQFKAIEATALEMWAARQADADPLSLTPTPEMCWAYGGCPYRDKCNLSPAESVAALAARQSVKVESGMANSLLEQLKARRASAGLPAPAAAPEAPAPAVAPAPLGVNPPESTLPPPEEPKRKPRAKKDPAPAPAPAPVEESPPSSLVPPGAPSEAEARAALDVLVDFLFALSRDGK